MLILHVSDIHFRYPFCEGNSDPDLYVRSELIAHARAQIRDLGDVDVILVTGDIAYCGNRREYDAATKWLEDMATSVGCNKQRIYVIPGNHDVDWNVFRVNLAARDAVHRIEQSGDNGSRNRLLLELLSNGAAAQHLFSSIEEYNLFAALYPRRRTSQPGKGHKIYPYLLRDLSIERANQAWASDISYIPMAKGFMYLVAIMDWYSRRVLSWRVSNTLDTDFCIEALEDALQRFEAPEIFNTDQGCQFTCEAFTDVLKGHAIAISMDGKGRWVDNVFVERLWRSVKYEDVYLRAYETPTELRAGLARYFGFLQHQAPSQRTGPTHPRCGVI